MSTQIGSTLVDTICAQCGATLTESGPFCTKCGARRNASAPIAAPRCCTKCGMQLVGEAKFCNKCGTPVAASATTSAFDSAAAAVPPSTPNREGALLDFSAAPVAPVPVSATPVVPMQAAPIPARRSSGNSKVVIAVVAMMVVFVVAGIAGVTYAVHRAKQKAAELEAQAEAEKARLASSLSDATNPQSGNNPAAANDMAKALAGLAAAAQNGNDAAAAEQLKKQLAQLAAAAQDPKTQAALRDLNNKLAGLSSTGQNPGGGSAADTHKDLAAIAAAASALGQGNAGGSGPPAGVAPATSAAGIRTIWAVADDLNKRLGDLQRDAPDQKASAAVNALSSKLEQLTTALERAPNDSAAKEDLNKGLADIAAAADNLTPAFVAGTDAALTPPPIPSGPPMVPIAGTGNPKHDWPLEYERTAGGPEADLVIRTGDINNLGFGWPNGFDPFSGQSTPIHPGPNIYDIPPNAPPGTDRIMIGSGVTPVHMHVQQAAGKLDRVMVDGMTMTKSGDGYCWSLNACYGLRPSRSGLSQTADHIQLPPGMSDDVLWVRTSEAAECTRDRTLTMPMPIVLDMGKLPSKITSVVVQIFADDFQAPRYGSHFQVSLNGTRIPSFEYVINSLDQSGPIGKLVTMRLLPEYWPLLKTGTVKLLIDDPTTHVQDGYAVDFVRILVNPHDVKYQVSLSTTVTDADTHKPIAGATVTAALASATTNPEGKCEFKGIPAGLVVATANAPGYDENSVPVDLPAGQSGHADIQLRPHQENTAALEESVAKTGTAAVYGIHFDTGSSKLRGDSMPALNAVLGLINGRTGSNWIISGHTDNQGSDSLNTPLSKARAASVVAWLTAHGVAAARLEPEGFGSTRPVADNATAGGRALNRRVEVSVAK